jgi:DNA helicase HerA-like ATPase
LRALVVFDEVYGFLPPHPQNPPTKRPLVALMKQARAFGVGVLIATQNPMDLDYRALGNAGLWCIGRLQTDADRARVLDGLSGSGGGDDLSTGELAKIVKRL